MPNVNKPVLYSVAFDTPKNSGVRCGVDHFMCYNPKRMFDADEFETLIRKIRESGKSGIIDILDALECEGFVLLDVIEYDVMEDKVCVIGNSL